MPDTQPTIPNGIVTALIDPHTGLLAPAGTPGAITEFMKVEDAARLESASSDASRQGTTERESFDIF